MRPAARSSSWLYRRLLGVVAALSALAIDSSGTGVALGAEGRSDVEGQSRPAQLHIEQSRPAQLRIEQSHIELCFVEPVDEQLRLRIVQLLQARLEPQRWILTSCTETSTSSGLARLRRADLDLALLLEAHGDPWRVYVVEPGVQRSVTREIGGATRDAAASEAVVSIAIAAAEATTAKTERLDARSEPAEPETRGTPRAAETARPSEVLVHGPRRGAPPAAPTGGSDGIVAGARDTAQPADAAQLRWGLGVGADFGAPANAAAWSFGPMLAVHAFWGPAPLSGEVRMHAARHLPRTLETGVGSFDWSRTLLGVNAGPTWWLARHANLGVDAGLEWERATREREVARDGVEGLPGRPRYRGAAEVNLIGTLFVAGDLGLRLSGGAQWWFGETRYVASNGELLLAHPRLNGASSLSLLWRIP